MRIAVDGIYDESNTFFSQRMTMEKFDENDFHFSADILEHRQNACSEISGFMEGDLDGR